MKAVITLLLSCFVFFGYTQSTCNHPDYDALMQLYNATGGPNWTNNSGWKDGADSTNCEPCTWAGVLCDTNSRVVELQLTDNNLEGSLPDLSLEFLRLFACDSNKLSGSLPDLEGLEKISEIDFSNNILSGCIPPSYCNLIANDISLALSGNPLLPYQGDLLAYCESGSSENAPCDDGRDYTSGDIIQPDCDCLGVSNDSSYVSLDIENSVCGLKGRETHVPVRVYQYRDVAALQLTITSLDTSFAEIVGWSGVHPQSGLPNNAFGVVNKKLKLVYADETGRNLPDSSVLFYVRLKLKEGLSDRAVLTFEDELILLNNKVEELSVLPAAGSVSVCPTNVSVACPSDAVAPNPPVVGDSFCKTIIQPQGPVQNGTTDGCERTITYTWTYEDCEANNLDWVYTYTIGRSEFMVPDNESTTLSCPSQTDEIPQPPLVIDSCGDEIMPEGPVVSDQPECAGSRTYTWTYADCEGNELDWVFTYTVEPAEFQAVCPETATYCENVDGFYDAPWIEYNDSCEQGTQVFFNITGATIREGEGNIASGEFNPGISYLNWLVVSACDTAQCITEIMITPISSSETTVNACGPYVWNDETFSESGTYEYYTTNQQGCDSIAYLILTIEEAITSETEVTACETYTWNGTTYTNSGIYTFATTNVTGCDSIATLKLTINRITTSEETATSCETYTWNGTVYTQSGTYVFNTSNAAGCDSIATLSLTINRITTSEETQTACETYTWNGTVYTQSGTYTFNTTNAVGCDSIATLNLTINRITTSEETATSCETYTWNGTTYTQSGTYTFNTTNSGGCDSLATLVLEIRKRSFSADTVTACETYTWNGIVYTESGQYTFKTFNTDGCDSTATLFLEILEAPCGGNENTKLVIESGVCGEYDQVVCVPVRAYNFSDIAALQLSVISEDTSKVEVVGVCDIYEASGLTEVDFATLNQKLVLVSAGIEKPLADSSVLFGVLVRIKDSISTQAELRFEGDILALNENFGVIEVEGIRGSICIRESTASVSGIITDSGNKGMSGVKVHAVSLNGKLQNDTTDIAGNFYLGDLTKGADYKITPSCQGELLNGVDVTDILILRRHLLGVSIFNSPFLFVAADLNFDKTVDLSDLLYLRRMLVGTLDSLPENADAWRFIPKSYAFPTTGSPLEVTIPDHIQVASVSGELVHQDFTGVKYGDLNNSADPCPVQLPKTEVRGFSGVTLSVSSAEGKSGDEVWVDITCKNFEGGAAMQFSLAWPAEKLTLVSVPEGADEILIEGLTSLDSRYINSGILSFIWESDNVLEGTTLVDKTICYRLRFKILGNPGSMADIISTSEIRNPKFVNGALQEQPIAIETGKITVSESSNTSEEFNNVAIYPNPTSGLLHIQYGTKAPESVSLLNSEGRVLKTILRGENVMDLSAFTAGVYMVRLQLGELVVHKKVVLIR